MLVLFESSAGYVLFKADDGKLKRAGDDIHEAFEAGASDMVKFQAIAPFKDTTEAVVAATAIVESKLDKGLKKFLKKHIASKNLGEILAVSDPKLGGLIKEKLNIQCVNDKSALEVIRGIRGNFMELVPGVGEDQMRGTALGLSHSLSRYKLKFSPDKVDTMIVQAINLLDELDKEVNTYAMRVREWYGWHFPEMAKILSDNMQYAKVVRKVGLRVKMAGTDFSDILEEDTEKEMKATAEVSMGTEISEDDIENIQALCEQVISMAEYRAQLFDYLKNRMAAIAPNLTIMVGELVGARLIAHAGSLMNLAKSPASTVQILGAEKALFRALKTKHDTPKYGLIYHASLIGQAAPKNKGKISRVLAAKCALSIRVDALGDEEGATIGYECREKVEARVRQLETGQPYSLASSSAANGEPKKYDRVAAIEGSAAYNAGADNTVAKRKRESVEGEDAETKAERKARKKAKKEKKAAAAAAMEVEEDSPKKVKKAKKSKKEKKAKKSS